jgi:hypothetical protein
VSRVKVWIRRAPRYVVPVFAALLVIYGAFDIGPAWSAAHGGGRAGTFTVRDRSCGRRLCAWRGEFHSDDGTVVRNEVTMRDSMPDSTHLGDDVRARDTGDLEGVFAESGSQVWRGPAMLMAGSGAILLAWLVWLTIMARRRRPDAAPAHR